MICPWLIKTVIRTNNKNSYNDSLRTEHQEFDKCMKGDCPFYALKHRCDDDEIFSIPVCNRVEIEKAKHLPLSE